MAIDTALKRASASGLPVLLPGITPDAGAGGPWRTTAAWTYAGMVVQAALNRRSVSGMPLLLPGVTPDVTPNVSWRKAVAWSYGTLLILVEHRGRLDIIDSPASFWELN